MSRKKITNNRLLGLLAFVSLLMSGICYVLNKLNVGNGILPTIAYAFLLIVVLWTAWDFAKDLSAGWKIVYYILAVLAIGGFVFGYFHI
jgi:hypothetical protein